jgi:hypothetical protein
MGNRNSHTQLKAAAQDGDLDNSIKQAQCKFGNLVWTQEVADHLQEEVDHIFGIDGGSLASLHFSVTIADPSTDECPIIARSSGFVKMCGCHFDEALEYGGHFLSSGIPDEGCEDIAQRKHTKDFLNAVKLGQVYRRPCEELEPWMPEGRPADELIVLQRDARKDGTYFDHVLYMKVFTLSSEVKPYVVGLHAEMSEGKTEISELVKNLAEIDSKMEKMKNALAATFLPQRPTLDTLSIQSTSWAESSSSSWTTTPQSKDALSPVASAPQHLSNFVAAEVHQWEEGRFKHVKTLCKANRNNGVVQLRRDQTNGKLVAVKQMPNSWMRRCHEEFLQAHPTESEMPWKCIGCTRFLNSIGFPYACQLQGVYRDSANTYVLSEYCSGGDLFDLAQSSETPGPQREHAFSQYVVQLFYAVKQLHDMGIVHRDISLENVLLAPGPSGELEIRVIDFGVATTKRHFRNPCAKVSYQSPEMHTKGLENDGFLCDTFAVGVIVHTLFAKGYPWASTKPGTCKCYEYFQKHGYRAYCAKQKVRGTDIKVVDCFSEPLMEMVEGLLSIDPKTRLTLGEKELKGVRKSVWDEKWLEHCRTFTLG